MRNTALHFGKQVSIREEPMTPKFILPKQDFSATLLRSAAVAIALIAQASPAGAETLTLACESTAEGSGSTLYKASLKFQVDLGQRIVNLLTPTDGVMASTTDRRFNAVAPSVQITDSAIVWRLSNGAGEFIFRGVIDRTSGTAEAMWFEARAGRMDVHSFQGRCRRATQKF